MANIFEINRPSNKITLGTAGTTINIASHTASRLLALDASKDLEVVTIGTGLDYSRPILDTIQDIRTSASPTFAGLHINSAEEVSTTLLTLESDIDNDTEYNEILFKVTGGQNYGAIRSYVGATTGDSYMSLLTTTDGGTLVQQVIIQHDGKVGLGKFPSQKLDIVAGNSGVLISDTGEGRGVARSLFFGDGGGIWTPIIWGVAGRYDDAGLHLLAETADDSGAEPLIRLNARTTNSDPITVRPILAIENDKNQLVIVDKDGNVGITGAVTGASFGGIASANLLDKSAAETITGIYTHTAILKIQSNVQADGYLTMLLGADVNANTLTDNTRKSCQLGMPHYDIDEQAIALFYGDSSAATNYLNLGGGAGAMNAATHIRFFTAANTITTTGTERMRIESDGDIVISQDLAVTGAISAANYTAANLLTACATDAGELNFSAASKTLTVEDNAIVSQDYSSDASPQFTGIELGHASDTTITRVSAGVVAVEGTNIAMVGGAHHDGFSDSVANEHIDHTGVAFTAGTGLTGGGDISANRTFAVNGLLEDLDTLGAVGADSEFLVGTGAGVLAWESGATARTSLGLGTGDRPAFAGINTSKTSEVVSRTYGFENVYTSANTVPQTWFAAGISRAKNTGSGGITNSMTGFHCIMEQAGSGTIVLAKGGLFQVQNTHATGVITTARTLDIKNPYLPSTGTIGTLYGLYLGVQSHAKVTTAYGIYQVGTSDINYFAGSVGFGLNNPKTQVTIEGTLTLKEQASADGDTAAYGQIWCKNTAPNVPWFTDDEGNDGQFMLMKSKTINSDSDAADVHGCNVLWVDTSGGNIVLGGLTNGVDNQLLYVFKYDQTNVLTIEHQEGTGTQKFMLNGGNLVYNGIGICLPFICKGGTWYIAAYPRSFAT